MIGVASASFGAAAQPHLLGQQRAAALLNDIRQGVAHPDALARLLEALADHQGAAAGACRAIQKQLECGGAPGRAR